MGVILQVLIPQCTRTTATRAAVAEQRFDNSAQMGMIATLPRATRSDGSEVVRGSSSRVVSSANGSASCAGVVPEVWKSDQP